MSYHPAGGVSVGADVPTPPPGPGAAPPFAAPPTDRNKRGLWIGLSAGFVLLALCCVGAIVGVGALVVFGTEEAKKEATATVERYLDAVMAEEWTLAHDELCPSLAARVTASQLAQQESRQPFTQYALDEPAFTEAGGIDVLAHLNTSSGEVVRQFRLDTADEGQLAICAIVTQ